jgi:tRNA (adenine57-N1/adenine58-N1)-methyltransferase
MVAHSGFITVARKVEPGVLGSMVNKSKITSEESEDVPDEAEEEQGR